MYVIKDSFRIKQKKGKEEVSMIFNNLRNTSDYKRKSNVNGKQFFSNTFSTLLSKIIIIKISMIIRYDDNHSKIFDNEI